MGFFDYNYKKPGMNKKGKELKLDIFKNYNVVYGTVDNKNLKAIYISISSWSEPQIDDDINYNRAIKDLDKAVRQNIYNQLTKESWGPFLRELTIVDFDIRKSGIKFGKRSFLSCEITLFTKDLSNIGILKPKADDIVKQIIDKILETNKVFKFHKKKR